jgi:hypothetical protein
VIANIRSFVVVVLLFSGFSINAFGGHEIQELNWNNPTETLKYHTCGCADLCWVAEVRSRKTNQLKAKLACDCEKLYVRLDAKKSDRIYKNDCSAFETDEKFTLIPRTMKSLLNR